MTERFKPAWERGERLRVPVERSIEHCRVLADGDMLAGDYTGEQKALEEQIPEKEARLEKLKAASANVNTFVEKAKQYTAIDELTPELLRLFIQRIEVGERTEKYSRSSHQSIRIVYRDIGTVDSEMEQGEAQPRIAPPLSEVFQLPA